MKKFIINKKTKIVIEDNASLGDSYRTKNWIKATKEEVSFFEAKKIKKEMIFLRINYLKNTDWYILRKLDSDKNIPDEISNKRKRVRKEINIIENINNIKDLKKYEV